MLSVFLSLLFATATIALSALEAEGLVRYGFCTSAAASNDCSWASNCRGAFCGTNPPNIGRLNSLTYFPKNSDTYTFRGISLDFTRYFENISALYVNDTQLSPPVRWTLSNLAAHLKKVDVLGIYSQPGGLFGTLPSQFASPKLGGIVIDGELGGTIPESLFENLPGIQVQLLNHKLVGTIPSILLYNAGTIFRLPSANGALVGEIPHATTCELSSGYSTGIGNNGGLFCECTTSCTPDQVTGQNACYNYTNPLLLVDPCAAYAPLPNCQNTKLTMRYGVLCYDVCATGCPSGTACRVQFEANVPSFACLAVVVETVTTTTTDTSNSESKAARNYAILSTLLSNLL